MKEVFLYSHGGSENHGCEALVRTTSRIIGSQVKRVFSLYPEQDIKYNIDEIIDIENDRNNSTPLPKRLLASAQIRLLGNNGYSEYLNMAHQLKGGDIAVSIGGDNYCYKGFEQYCFKNRVFNNAGIKTVLWGCSIEPDMINETLEEDLKRYSYITARESITYEAIKDINPNTYLFPDPAFTLEKSEVALPAELEGKKLVGINLSPLVIGCGKDGVVMKNYENLVGYILKNTDYSIALIPHVVWKSNDDRVAMKPLLEKFDETGRIFMIDDCSCREIKGYISRCDLFIGARTHATIAAYSTCVPTLVAGYSVKSRGIAKDLFGTQENYVLSVQDMKSDGDLTEKFIWLSDNRQKIKEHLENIMPSYIERAYEAGAQFGRIFGK